jgi:multiple sugar transport system substrate-binding protein
VIRGALLVLCGLLLAGGMSCSRKPEEAPGKVTIVFWHSFVSSTIPSLEDLIAEFERTHPAIHVRAQYIPTGDGLIQKLVSAVQSKTTPDVSWIHADFLDKLVEAGAILPMIPFIEGPDSLPAADLLDIYPSLIDAGMYHDTLYSLPMEATSLALFYNRGMFAEAGLDPDHPPETWQELKEYALRLTPPLDSQGRRDRYGFYVPVFPASGELNIWMNLQWTPFLWQAGGDEFSPDKRDVRFNGEPGVKALTLWKEIYRAEGFDRFGITHDLGFASGKLAMAMDGPWDLPRFRAMKGIDWRVAPLPAGPAGKATYIAGEQLAIFRESRHPAETWTFVKWILGREAQARFSMKSGYLPVRKSVLEMEPYKEFLESDPAMKSFVLQLRDSRGRQRLDRHRVELNRYLAEAIERALVGNEDPRLCLDEAASRCRLLLLSTGE